jgi:hypothetical protein
MPRMNLASSDMRSHPVGGNVLRATAKPSQEPAARAVYVARCISPQPVECAQSVPAVARMDNALAVISHC